MAQKSYLDLKQEVWESGKCSGCGACVAVCPADSLSFAEGENVKSPVSTGYCKQATDSVACGACYAACPRTGEQPSDTLGTYLELVQAKALFEIPRRQSGGAVTAILANALDEGLIDAVVTVYQAWNPSGRVPNGGASATDGEGRFVFAGGSIAVGVAVRVAFIL